MLPSMEERASSCPFVKIQGLLKVAFVLARELNKDLYTLNFMDYAEVISYNDELSKYLSDKKNIRLGR